MLDPACGSMHFGLYAFDLFETIYAEAWERGLIDQAEFGAGDEAAANFKRQIPRLIIEHNIHGIDIDPRAVQIAGLSLWLRAQRSWRDQGVRAADRPVIRKSNIVCAEPMPGDQAQLADFLQGLRNERLESLIRRVLTVPAHQRVRATPTMADALCELVSTVWHAMELAGEAGSLLKIEESLAAAIDRARQEWEQRLPLFRVETFRMTEEKPKVNYVKLVPGEEVDFWERAETLVLAALEEYAEQAQQGSGTARRLFAQDAARGFAFVDLCRKRYDVVLMNPPFGEPSKHARDYVGVNFPNSSGDILHAFVERNLGLLSDAGREGVLSARTGFFLGNSKDWRAQIVFAQRLACFADLGLGVLDDALVEVAAYAIENSAPKGNKVLVNRQLDNREKAERLLEAAELTVTGDANGFYPFDQSLISITPDQTFNYWAPASLLQRYVGESCFGETVSRVRQGVATADDFRFVRLGWEVANPAIGPEMRWQRFSKGGEYSPPYDDIHLLVEWGQDGAQLKAFPNCFIRNEGFYFEPGATYTVRTASAFAAKVLPADCIFSHNAQSWFTQSTDLTLLSIGFLSCRVPQAFLELAVGSGDIATSGSAARRYTTAVVESVPAGVVSKLNCETNLHLIRNLYQYRLGEFMADETSCHFIDFHAESKSRTLIAQVSERNRRSLAAIVDTLDDSARLDEAVSEAFAITEQEERFVESEVGKHPAHYEGTASGDAVRRLFMLPEEELIAEAVTAHGAKRWFTKKSYFVDRRVEIISHFLGISPRMIESLLASAPLSAGAESLVASLLSVLLGCAYGRWDIRYATGEFQSPPPPEPFDPLPVCPPGMLQNAAGLPATPADVPDDYPLRISWPGILVDDPGHPEDIVGRVRAALAVIWPETRDAIEQEACQILGMAELRAYFATPNLFFDDHLKRYSKSRRVAPIYWPLATPSGSYTLWLYYHRLSDEILYRCVNDFIDPKLAVVSRDAAGLRSRSRSAAQEQELAQLNDLAVDLQELRGELLRIAQFWRPNLNDGVQITAAPLWKLFRHRGWQSRLQETWETLEAGEYDWAHLAMSIWPARVVPKCVADRSLAIAHEVEDLFWVEEAGAWRKLLAPAEEIARQKEWARRKLGPEKTKKLLAALAQLAQGPARGLTAQQVGQHLVEGHWDDTEAALLVWPERVALKCLDDFRLADKLRLNLPKKRTQTAVNRFVKELADKGCPDIADALAATLDDDTVTLAQLLAELRGGRRDHAPVALALEPDRLVDACAADVALAELHGLRRFFWSQRVDGSRRRRVDPKREVVDEVARRQRI